MKEEKEVNQIAERLTKYLRYIFKRTIGELMPSKLRLKRSRGSVLDFITMIIGFLFIFYGFFAFTNPDKYPILRKTLELFFDSSLVQRIDPFLGLIVMLIGAYIIFVRK